MGMLFLSLYALHKVAQIETPTEEVFVELRYVMAGIFFLTSVARVPLALRGALLERKKFVWIKETILAGVYLLIAVLYLVLPSTVYVIAWLVFFYLLAIAGNRICRCFEVPRKGFRVLNVLFALLLLGTGVSLIVTITTADIFAILILLLAILMVVSLGETLAFALSSIKLRGILKIMRKTYAFEILYGMIILVLSFSFFFMITEEKITTYGDGLWYCFSLLTTIGLGDVYAVTVVGRILSVILGIYGLIVVAVVTSIIINFYNDSKATQVEESKEEPSTKELPESKPEEPKEENKDKE